MVMTLIEFNDQMEKYSKRLSERIRPYSGEVPIGFGDTVLEEDFPELLEEINRRKAMRNTCNDTLSW